MAGDIQGIAETLDFMKPNVSYDASQIAMHLGVSAQHARHILGALMERGEVETRGTKRSIKYQLTPERPELPPMKPLTISREMRIAMDRCEELRVHPSNFGTRA